MSPRAVQLLAVCTGNICRSPVMELLLRHELGDATVVTSGGTHAVVDAPIAPAMARLIHHLGVDSSHFSARQLTKEQITHSDLILTATRQHRSRVVHLDPRAVKKTFTLLEYAIAVSAMDLGHLTGLSLPERLSVLTDYVQSSRPRLPLTDKLDIIDPYGYSDDVYDVAFALIHQCVTTLSYALTFSDPASSVTS